VVSAYSARCVFVPGVPARVAVYAGSDQDEPSRLYWIDQPPSGAIPEIGVVGSVLHS